MEETPATPATADLMEGLDDLAHQDYLDFVSFLESPGTGAGPPSNNPVGFGERNLDVQGVQEGQGQIVSGWGQSTSLQTPEFPQIPMGMGVGFGSIGYYQQQCSSTSQHSTQTQLVQEFDTIVGDLENFNAPDRLQHEVGNLVEMSTIDFDCLRDEESAAFPIAGAGNFMANSHKKERVHETPRGPFGVISQDENRLGLVSTQVGGRPEYTQGTFRGHQMVTSTWVAQQSNVIASTTQYGIPPGMNPGTMQINPSFGSAAAVPITLPQTLTVPVGEGHLHSIIPATGTVPHFHDGTMSYEPYGNGGMFQSNITNSTFSSSSMMSISSSSEMFQGPFQRSGEYVSAPGMPQQSPFPNLPVQGTDLTSTQNLMEGNRIAPPTQLLQTSMISQRPVSLTNETVEASRTSGKEVTPTFTQPGGKTEGQSMKAGRLVLGSPKKKPSASISKALAQKSKKGQKSKALVLTDSPPKSKVPKPDDPKIPPLKLKKSPKKKEYFARAPPAIRVIPHPLPAKVEKFVEVERVRRKAEDKEMMDRFFKGLWNTTLSYTAAGNTGNGTSTDGNTESGIAAGGSVVGTHTGTGNEVEGNVKAGNPNKDVPVLKDLLQSRPSGGVEAAAERPAEKKFVEEGLMQQLMTMIFQKKPSAQNIQVKDALLEQMGKSPSAPPEVKASAQEQTQKLSREEKDRQMMDKFMDYVFQKTNPPEKSSGGETGKPSGHPVTPTFQAPLPTSLKKHEEPQRMDEFELNDMIRMAANEMLGGMSSMANSPEASKKPPSHYAPLASPVTPETAVIDLTTSPDVPSKSETGGGDQSVSSSTPEIRVPEMRVPRKKESPPVPLKPTTPALFLQGLLRLRLQIKQFEEKTRTPLGYARKMYAGGTNPHVNKVIWITAAMQVMEDVMSEVDREIGRRSEGISMTPNKDIREYALQIYDILMRSAKWIVCGSQQADLITFNHQMFIKMETKFFPMHNDMPRQFDGRQTAPTNFVWRHPQWIEHTKGILKIVYFHPARVELTYNHLAALRT